MKIDERISQELDTAKVQFMTHCRWLMPLPDTTYFMVLLRIMSTHRTISFRLDEEKVTALDELAQSVDRDRSHLLNEAVANYLELQEYHARLVKAGLAAVKKGQTIKAAEVRKRIAKLARGLRSK